MSSVKVCPECGSEYLTAVERCFDCDVPLVASVDPEIEDEEVDAEVDEIDTGVDDEVDDDDGDIDDDDDDEDDEDDEDDADGDDADEQVEYELHEWSAELRVMLEQLLAGAGVARVWEGTTVVVAAVDEAAVDELIDQVEVTDDAALDPDAEKVVYEVSEWSVDQLRVLLDALGEAGIPYEFDVEGDLAVLTDDEERVEDLLDSLEFPAVDSAIDAGEGDPDDGIETAGILSDLFVAVDRLQHDATDHEGVLGVVSATERLEGRPLPFGFGPALWQDIIDRAVALRSEIDDDEVEDDDLCDHAKSLRTLLRQYV